MSEGACGATWGSTWSSRFCSSSGVTPSSSPGSRGSCCSCSGVRRVEQLLEVGRQRDLGTRQVGLAGQRSGLGPALAALLAEALRRLPARRSQRGRAGVPAVVERVGAEDARLVGTEVRVAALEGPAVLLRPGRRVAEVEAVGRSRERGAQHVARVVEQVDAERLPVEVVPERLHAREAAAARDGGGVGGRRCGRLRARVLLDRAPAVVDRLEELAQRRAKGRALLESSRSSAISWRPSVKARVPTAAASPSVSMAGRLASANGPTRVRKESRSGAARRRSVSSGVCSSARSPRRSIVGRSSSRKVGSRRRPARSSSRLPAVISAASPASSTQRTTSRLLRSSSVITVSESAMKSLITAFWSPRIRSVREVSRRPGCARRSTSWRSSGRPASPVPSSARISRRRSR